MVLLLLSLLSLGANAYKPSVAEWSLPINPHPRLAARDLPQVTLTSTEQLAYSVDVVIGNTSTKLLLDSGSFSLWTATPNYQCTDLTSNFTQEICGVVGAWDSASDPDAAELEDSLFSSRYGSGFAVGTAWNTTVNLAGLEVENLTIGYADRVNVDSGDGEISGIMGLGIGVSTGFYWNDTSKGGLQPTGFFSRLKEKLERWQFAITFGRGISNGPTDRSNTGVLSFGGISPDMGDFSKTEFVTLNISDADQRDNYTFWGGAIDGATFDNSSGLTPAMYSSDVLVDSGTAYMILGRDIFTYYNLLWVPNATFVEFTGSEAPGYYYVECDAFAPDLSIVIGGKYVNVSSSDLIYRTENGTCRSAVVAGLNSARNILGMPFFKSNLVVFDGDNQAMHFGPKPPGVNV